MKRLSISALLILIASQLFSFSFEPISTNFTPSGPRSNQIFRVSNNENRRVAVKISVATRESDLYGVETNNPADDLFMIYPSRMVLNPGDVKSVRVKWQGDSDPEGEVPFRIIAEQIPVDFEPTDRTSGGGIRLSFKYIGNIYILPPGGEPDIVVESKEIDGNELVLTIVNRGHRHTLLGELSMRILSSAGEQLYQLTPEEVKPAEGVNFLCNSPRELVFTLSPDTAALLESDGWEVAFDFDPIY